MSHALPVKKYPAMRFRAKPSEDNDRISTAEGAPVTGEGSRLAAGERGHGPA